MSFQYCMCDPNRQAEILDFSTTTLCYQYTAEDSVVYAISTGSKIQLPRSNNVGGRYLLLFQPRSMARSDVASSSKFIAEPKAVYSLSIENLSNLASYSPNATTPDSLVSKVNLPAGVLFTTITAATEASQKRWSTVQVSKGKHVELNSALMYMNHSCDPSLEIDTDMMEVRVSKAKDLKIGDELDFFYPSTEFEMDKPFECLCGAKSCLGTVTGAAEIEQETLKKWFVNEHIIKLKQEQALANRI